MTLLCMRLGVVAAPHHQGICRALLRSHLCHIAAWQQCGSAVMICTAAGHDAPWTFLAGNLLLLFQQLVKRSSSIEEKGTGFARDSDTGFAWPAQDEQA